MADNEIPQNSRIQATSLPPEPTLNLLLRDEIFDEPLYRCLSRGLDEFVFPKKLPPLVLTSKPVPVRDIWGFYNYKSRGAFGSTILHIIVVAIIISGALFGRKVVEAVKQPPTVTLIAPDTTPTLKPSKTLSGRGRGGGARHKVQAPQRRLTKNC